MQNEENLNIAENCQILLKMDDNRNLRCPKLVFSVKETPKTIKPFTKETRLFDVEILYF